MTATLVDQEKLLVLMEERRLATIEHAAALLEHEASYCDAVASDEKDFLPVRAAAFEKAETMKRCAEIIRTLKHAQ